MRFEEEEGIKFKAKEMKILVLSRNGDVREEILLLLLLQISTHVVGAIEIIWMKLWCPLVDVLSRPLCWQSTLSPQTPLLPSIRPHSTVARTMASFATWSGLTQSSCVSDTFNLFFLETKAKQSCLRCSQNCQMLFDVILCSLGKALFFSEICNYFLWKLFLKSWRNKRKVKKSNKLLEIRESKKQCFCVSERPT